MMNLKYPRSCIALKIGGLGHHAITISNAFLCLFLESSYDCDR